MTIYARTRSYVNEKSGQIGKGEAVPNKNKFLIVDDDIITRNIAKLIFRDNFEALEAGNGREALLVLQHNRRDIIFVLCDVSMPVMDGITFLEEKNKLNYSGIPVIMITSVGDEQIREQAILNGAADFLDKPLDPGVVRLRVNNVMSNYGIGYAYNDSLQREFLDLINNQIRGGTLSVYDGKDYPIHYISESLAVYLGYESAEELVDILCGKWINMFSRDDFKNAEKIMKSQLLEKGEFIHEHRLRKKNGEYIWVRENGKYSLDDAGSKRIVALCVDITDIKNAEEKARYNEQLASIALESGNMSIWEYDFQNRCIIQGQNSIKVHGLDAVVSNVPESLTESGFVHPDSAEAFIKMYESLAGGAEKADGIFKIRSIDGTGYWNEHIRYVNTFDEYGKPYRAIGVSNDVTEQEAVIARYQREIELNRALSPDIFSTARLNLTRETIEEIHTDIDEDKDIIEDLDYGGLRDCLAKFPFISSDIYDYFCTLTKEYILEVYESGKRIITYEFLKKINGIPKWVRFELHLTKDPNNNELLAFVYFRDIDEQRREMEFLREQANCDRMTGLYNHDMAMGQIKEYISSKGTGHNHAMFMVDVDKFKTINDRYGHMEGDRVLIDVAQKIKAAFRADDIVGRVGGDEFIALMKNVTSAALVEKKAKELAGSTQFDCGNTGVVGRCSIGVAIYRDKATDFDELYKRADSAMYKAKQSCGVGYVIDSD